MVRVPSVLALSLASSVAHAGLAGVDHYNGHTYAFITNVVSFDTAQELCASNGFDLVTINDLNEEAWLMNRTFRSRPGNRFAGYLNTWIWVGAFNDHIDAWGTVYDAINDPSWGWISGEPLVWQNFDGAWNEDPWNYEAHGAAITLVDPATARPFGAGHNWQISPQNYNRAFVCESR